MQHDELLISSLIPSKLVSYRVINGSLNDDFWPLVNKNPKRWTEETLTRSNQLIRIKKACGTLMMNVLHTHRRTNDAIYLRSTGMVAIKENNWYSMVHLNFPECKRERERENAFGSHHVLGLPRIYFINRFRHLAKQNYFNNGSRWPSA